MIAEPDLTGSGLKWERDAGARALIVAQVDGTASLILTGAAGTDPEELPLTPDALLHLSNVFFEMRRNALIEAQRIADESVPDDEGNLYD